MSEAFWHRQFGAHPAMVGLTISLNNEPHDLIGVLGPFDTDAIQSRGHKRPARTTGIC